MGTFCHMIGPLLLFYIYKNIAEGNIKSSQNQALVIAIVVCRLIRVLGCYYGDIEQNKAGLKIYRLMANAILKKTINCSPLTNKNISSAELSKMMHSDCSVLQMYPAKLSYMIENGVAFVVLSGTIIWVSGLIGIIGILLLGANFLFRYLFRKLMMST